MRFLIDNQLPPALARHLQARGTEAIHVADLQLDHASDRDIWQFARINRYVIVSKDQDFLNLSAFDSSGPSMVWVRLGNCRRMTLLAAFDRVLPDLLQALESGSRVVEVR